MPKLKKTKAFSVSEKTLFVKIQGINYEIANLEKSKITNQNIILIAINDVWEEINILNLGDEKAILDSFISHVELHNLTLSDLGLEAPKKTYEPTEMKHENFLELQEIYPEFDYIQIAVLNDFLLSLHIKTSMWELKGYLTEIKKRGQTIKEFINQSKIQSKIMETKKNGVPANQVDLVEEITAENKIKSQSKKEISIQVFSELTPEKITELQGIKESQDLVISQNPFIKVTDKITLEKAKKSRQALLSASTSTEAIETNATKFLNQFKGMIKTTIAGLAKSTRDAHKAQDDEIKSFENEEAIRIANEEREKLGKIKSRTDLLFAIPMTFNGQIYSIENLYVLPSQIEGLEDDKFNELVEQGKMIAKKIEGDKLLESKKDQEIADLKAKLEALMSANGLPAETEIEPIQVVDEKPISIANINVNNPEVVSSMQNEASNPIAAQQHTASQPAKKLLVYNMPESGNSVLNNFDLQHTNLFENQAFLKYREGFIKGSIATVNEIIKIIDNGGKSQAIRDFATIINQTKL